jgi:very-short-patch-repair endonuclease
VDPVAALRAAGGAARAPALLRAGATRRALAAAVGSAVATSPAPGLFVLPGCPRERIAAAAVDGVLSCLDAARDHGLTVLRPVPSVHVVAGRGSTRTWPGTVVHRRDVPPGGHPIGLVATLWSVAGCHPLATAVSLVDEALRTGRCTLEDLAVVGGPRWRLVLRAADARAMSSLESLARVEVVGAVQGLGLTVELQVRLRGVGSVDLLVDGWLVVELDGSAFHADRAAHRRDRERDQVLSSHGYVWLRATFEDVVRSGGRLSELVVEVWRRGRPPGFRSLRRT